MLTSLSIRDVVLIESLDLEFGPGLGVLTGETGAGKSILLDALGLALGARADSGLVRQGQAQAVVSVSFDLTAAHPARALLADNGLDSEPGEPLVIRRIVKADGGSRALVNDQSASVALLRDLGALLVEIHGQHDDRGLLNPRGHRALLDAFAGVSTAGCEAAFRAWGEAEAALAAARDQLDAAARDREWLEHSVAELTKLAPEAGEEEALAGLRATMQKGARLAEDIGAVGQLLDGSEGGLSLLRQAARRLERIAGEHERLEEALAALDRALVEASDAEDRLAAAAEALAYDPARLEEAEARLFEIRAV
ncbi:MAG TPA: AAA family ATPase, partial [Allosphingosinicella sp.]|nr:AAA family ATPase [Allosphingosinicella sp.]